MQLRNIDKPSYKQKYKYVVFSVIAGLAVLSLIFSSVLIALYGSTEGGSNTPLNAIGVALATLLIAAISHSVKHKPYFADLLYVWKLKQELTLINRRLNSVKTAAQSGDRNAMTILNYCYEASEQVWQLEDNTLVMQELSMWKAELRQLQQQFNVDLSITDYHRDMLSNY